LASVASTNDIRLIETRRLSDCQAEIRQAPGAFVTIELTVERCDEALRLMMELSRWRPGTAFTVVADRNWRNYEPLVRELGALHFVVSPRQIHPLAVMAARHLSQWSESEQTLTERTLARLPWSD